MKRIVVLISGDGTNLQYLIDNKREFYNIVAVFSNKKNAYGLERAKKNSINACYYRYDKNDERDTQDSILAYEVLKFNPDIVVLAGWMRILSNSFIQHFCHLINLHPALPGKFPGVNAIERAYKHAQYIFHNTDQICYYTGAMCHRVIEEVDAGEVLCFKRVRIEKTDTLKSVIEKISTIEKKVLLSAILLL
jgi:formyltetrahydrofolate-dependent phosphoribosylglycinamide formyltransferase